jgi:hypothetical protein
MEVPPQMLQNNFSAVPRLSDIVPATAYFPQAGTLPPVNTWSPAPPAPVPVASGPDYLTVAALALGAWFLFRRGKR